MAIESHPVTDTAPHWCCQCSGRIGSTAYVARERRGNRAEVCSVVCVHAMESWRITEGVGTGHVTARQRAYEDGGR